MKLNDTAALDRLVEEHPKLERSRRLFIVNHLKGLKPEEHPRVYAIFEKSMVAEEFDFVKACFGTPDKSAVRSGTPFLLKNRPNDGDQN